jgi:hypothetical protein
MFSKRMMWALFILLIGILLVLSADKADAVDITIIDIVGGSEEIVEFKKVDEGELITFQVTASDGSNCSISNLPKGATYQSSVFSWVPDAYQAGMYPISFHTTDANNAISYKNIRIVVADRIFNILANQPFEYLFMAMDPDEDQVEITITGLPTGATFTGEQYAPKLFQWTPTLAQIGTYNMTLTATDNPPEGPPLTDVSNLVITVATEVNAPAENPYDFNKDYYIDELDLSIFAPFWQDCIMLVQANCDSTHRDRILTADTHTLRVIEYFVTVHVRTDTDTAVYHVPGCRDLRRKPYYEVSLGRAREQNFTPHSKCKAHELLSEVNK